MAGHPILATGGGRPPHFRTGGGGSGWLGVAGQNILQPLSIWSVLETTTSYAGGGVVLETVEEVVIAHGVELGVALEAMDRTLALDGVNALQVVVVGEEDLLGVEELPPAADRLLRPVVSSYIDLHVWRLRSARSSPHRTASPDPTAAWARSPQLKNISIGHPQFATPCPKMWWPATPYDQDGVANHPVFFLGLFLIYFEK